MGQETAILLIHCPDHPGIVTSVTEFIFNNNGNILTLEQHVEEFENHFFMRVEWDLDNFAIPREKIKEFFSTLVAKKFGMQFILRFNDFVPRVALFVSRYSHCFFDILSRYESKEWKIEIPLIISNHDKFRYVAERYNIPYYHIPITKENKAEAEAEEIALLKKHKVDLVVLARYMQVLTGNFIDEFPNQIINIHHSSLPAFAGANPYKSAFQRGVKLVGATAHYVTEDLDAGPIIAQEVRPVTHREGLADLKRTGKNTEKFVLAQAIWLHLNHKILSYKNKTVVFS